MTAGDRSIVERIESRCHWVITIRPADLVPDRIPDRDLLYPLVRDSAVLVDGRYFPAYDAEPLVLTEGPDWVQFDYQWLADLQSWRFFQSGQLTVLLSVWTEWTATPMLKQPPNPSGPSLPISDSLSIFSAVFAFAARLATSEAGSDRMAIEIAIRNLRDAQLVQDDFGKTALPPTRFPDDSYTYSTEVPRDALVANAQQLASEASSDLLQRFRELGARS
ncbi:MAG: hypothetical protein M9947_16690 [Thermomicrobiales bacterium]|nr:hypothetical protein [Thermomicrobiales bacterium]